MKRPEFTKKQEYWICDMIGDWYLFWKDKICNKDGTHHLGFAKEQLKMMLCDYKENLECLTDLKD